MIDWPTYTRTRAAVACSAEVATSPAAPAPWLDPLQRGRWSALQREQDRRDFLAARAIAARLVGEAAGVDPATVRFEQSCIRCGGPHGRPRVTSPAGWHVSWSHAAGWVTAGVSDRPCGVDVEPVAGQPVILSVLSPGEAHELSALDDAGERTAMFVRWWVRKEAVLKAAGLGLVDAEPSGLDVRDDIVRLDGATWLLSDLPTPPEVRAAWAEQRA